MPWGSGGWGATSWGNSVAPFLRMLRAFPVRENLIRIEFNKPIRFTGILDPNDGSDRERYNVVVVAGTFGADESPVRDVDPAAIELATFAGAVGRFVDVITDRSMTPYPARYITSVNQLIGADGTLLEAGFSSFEHDGLFRGLKPPSLERAVARRDFANPQSLEALLDVSSQDPSMLASYVADETGDYARDEGLTSYRKRIFRRLTTQKSRIAHLPGYGVSLIQNIKQLAKRGVREAFAADAEDQIRQEPETQAVSVRFFRLKEDPSVTILRVRAKASFREIPVELDVPLLPPAGDIGI